MSLIRTIVVIVLLSQALFWGLLPHSIHCKVVETYFGVECPPHIFHILLGIVCFLLAVYISNYRYTSEVSEMVGGTIKNVGMVGKSLYKFAKTKIGQFNSVEDFTNYVDKLSKK